MRVLTFGTFDVRAHPRVGILADGLRRHGCDVQECNVPLGIDTAGRVAILQRPWLLPKLALRIVRCWATLVRRARAMPPPDVVLVGYLGHFDVLLARLLFRRTPIVLDHLVFAADTAWDRGARGGVKQALLRALDRAALRSADVIVVDTEEHRSMVPAQWYDRAVVVPVGAAQQWFDAGSAAAEDSGARPTGGVRVVFYGVYTPLHGAPVIGQALSKLADDPVDVTMIGNGQELAATRAAAAGNPRVTWLSWVEPEDLPKLVADHDICLGVFGTSPKARRVVPNKVYQGAAAGCAIVTSDTAPQRRVLGDRAVFVPAGDPDRLAEALRSLAADPLEVARLRRAASSLARERFASHQVVEPLLDRLRGLAPLLEAS
ncbi:glycosyltransferase family 4 protein [Thermasporomyces composti]|uniref:Glycosyltransferase involved in cell wall biosynthesis n=1 Tax=Thermasporomyces composti TaxID=696763 RepID=A0A3D9VES1_THECX|nr:glycosyltransferase family 4 protein [Thermasporomyces composti]REF37635.1 glycosyltransferase involved in cell wall biosynthesis [Thermasporomyces composti]